MSSTTAFTETALVLGSDGKEYMITVVHDGVRDWRHGGHWVATDVNSLCVCRFETTLHLPVSGGDFP